MFDDSSEDNSESSDNEDEQVVDIYNDCREGRDIRLFITLVLKV